MQSRPLIPEPSQSRLKAGLQNPRHGLKPELRTEPQSDGTAEPLTSVSLGSAAIFPLAVGLPWKVGGNGIPPFDPRAA